MDFVLTARRSGDTGDMKKLLLVIVFALSVMSTVSVHADPPAPFCPPFCDNNSTGDMGH
jgi:hypothetical protein